MATGCLDTAAASAAKPSKRPTISILGRAGLRAAGPALCSGTKLSWAVLMLGLAPQSAAPQLRPQAGSG
eukprot:370083-Pyramimonas_sp.AAC.1